MIQSVDHKMDKCYTVSTTITWRHQLTSTEMIIVNRLLEEIGKCSDVQNLRGILSWVRNRDD